MNWFDFFNFFSPAHNEKRPEDAALYARGERPKNGADARPCLSDVNKNGTQAKRRQADVPLYAISSLFSFLRRGLQMRRNFSTTCTTLGTRGEKLQADAALCGRSMVEMLGVLAIIGVLSVGAMSGYAKAMFKYKLNKQAEQLTQLYYAVLQIDITDGNMIPYLEKLDLIPQNMIAENLNYIYDIFNLQIVLSADSAHKNVVVSMTDTHDQNNAVCLNILNSAIPWAAELSHIGVDSKQSASDEQHMQDWFFGDNETRCTANHRCIRSLTLEQMQNLCQICNKDYCNLYIAFNK